MAEVIPFGEPENESERNAIDYLRAHLSASYKLFTNLEIKQGVEIFEIDLILVAPHCVYVVDIKNWHGRIEIFDPKWFPDNYQSYPSPLKKLRKHAKVVSSMICDTNRVLQQELSKVHVQATVLMTSDDVQIIDQSGTEGDYVTYLDKRCLDYFQSAAYIPPHRLRNIKPFLPYVERAILHKSDRKSAPLRYGNWQVEAKLGGNDRYTEYRAKNLTMGVSGWTARLRVYQVDPFLEPAAREAEYKLISNAFQAVRQLPPHPNILSVGDFFASHDSDCLVMVTEDVPGQVLRQYVKQNPVERIAIMQDILHGLEHTHKHGVIHRNITPDSILITTEGKARLMNFDYAHVSDHTTTIANELDDWGYAAYQAIECRKDPTHASITSDLFSAGLVFYELLTGFAAFEDANQIHERNAVFSVKPSERNPEISTELDRWLQKLCAFEPKNRFPNADAALREFEDASAALPSLRKRKEEQPVTPDKARLNLFDAPLVNSHQINPDSIVLDPTELYDIPSGYVPITTEVEWIKFFGVSFPCWVKGERLCAWASEWLQAWDKTEAIAEIKQHPRSKLAALFQPVPLPSEWTNRQLLILATKLDCYPQDNPIAHLLADITGSDRQIWFAEPSIPHLAAWLAIQVPEECKPLERVWQHQKHDLATYYQTENKSLLLRNWLGIAEPGITELGNYPLPVPDFLTEEFDKYWEQQIYRTEGKAVDNLMPNQAGRERIGNCAYKVFKNRPDWITKVREGKVADYLSHEQIMELGDRQPPPQPQPLALDASPNQAFTWATESYLPFRRWEIVINQPASGSRISDRLADSFVEWMLKHYPEMKVGSVDNSSLNYSVGSLVRNLCQQGPVLWVVVDGLGWLDHVELLSFLTKQHKLAVETAIQPRFSILPTKTEYAKWSLYAQLLPSLPNWVDDISKGFSMLGMGKRYTDKKVELLYKNLGKKAQLYCWDTQMFDHLYHSQKDWQSFYELERPGTLEHIAKKINYCLQQYPDPDELRIVIASDHGQIMGMSEKITHCPPGLEPKGRMAIGKTDDPRFVVLERDRYGLPHDISIVRGAASLSAFSYTDNEKIIGSHGGLFPEEVVVGVSVLRKSVQRVAVLISCNGEGKPGQPGELEIVIDNPNSVELTDLYLCIKKLPTFSVAKPLNQKIPANNKVSFKVIIPNWPELPPTHEGNCISLSGELTFRFAGAEAAAVALDSKSAIIVNQIFSSGIDDINEFF